MSSHFIATVRNNLRDTFTFLHLGASRHRRKVKVSCRLLHTVVDEICTLRWSGRDK